MEESRELHFTKKKRHHVAPNCPCGEVNSPKNPFFSPFEEFDGQYGHCHKCAKTFMPESEPQEGIVYRAPEKKPQQFIAPEPVFDWFFPDATIDPKLDGEGEYLVTWYFRDIRGRLTSAKQMYYRIDQGGMKRVKEKHPRFPYLRDSGYYGCLFYERDLTTFPDAKVILVESEKTAALMRRKFKANLQEFVYIATGGATGLTDEKVVVLKDREVLIVFDCDNGEKQPDGSVKSPKGREAAEFAAIKLAPICRPVIIDLYPERNDGTDLGDVYKEIDIEFLRNLSGRTPVDEKLITTLRDYNRKGQNPSLDDLNALAEEHMIHPDKIQTIDRSIQRNFADERGAQSGPLIQQIELWLRQNYEFRRNTVESRVYFRRHSESLWRPCNESDIWRDAQYAHNHFGKKKVMKSDIETILDSQFVPDFNPFAHYFESLAPWDGQDHITRLANHIQCDDQAFWVQQFKKSLVRMIACTIGYVENRIIMTLVQEGQETGKSTFVRFLCPPQLSDYYKESPMEHSKDSDIALAENFIWNLEELADLNKKEIAEMKAFISRKKVKQRRAYARHEESLTRIVNFWGSTNKMEFLSDTQNTRWLCFNVLSISHDYNNYASGTRNIDMDKVWAQAWSLYRTGFQYNLTAEEREHRDQVNHNFESMTDEKSLILRLFEQSKPDEGRFMSNLEIHEHLLLNTSQRMRLNSLNIGRSMSQLGFKNASKKVAGKTVRGYWVRTKDNGQQHAAPSQAAPIPPDPPTLFDNDPDLPF